MPIARLLAPLAPLAPLALLLAAAPAAYGGVIYGLSSSPALGTPGNLYTIDSATGAATLVAPLSNVFQTGFVGLEARGGVLYATNVAPAGGGPTSFGTINPATGAFTPISSQGVNNLQSLAYSPAADLFYTVQRTAGTGFPLLSVTPAGAFATIGITGVGIRGLAFDGNHNVLYGVDEDELFTIDPATGAATLVGPLGRSNALAGLAYDTEADVLYLNVGGLFRVDVGTGAATLVGPNGPTADSGIDGLAFIPSQQPPAAVPEPSTLALLGVVSLGLAARRRFGRRA